MKITTKQKAEVVKKFLEGTSLQYIVIKTKLTREQILDILAENSITRELLKEYIEEKKAGKFVNFFYEQEIGRPKLPENQKRKLRQIRISDDEMKQLGNPSSTQIRNNLFRLRKIEELCNRLDELGIELIPKEWLHAEYNPDDLFWQRGVYSSNYSRLCNLAENKRLMNELQEIISGGERNGKGSSN